MSDSLIGFLSSNSTEASAPLDVDAFREWSKKVLNEQPSRCPHIVSPWQARRAAVDGYTYCLSCGKRLEVA